MTARETWPGDSGDPADEGVLGTSVRPPATRPAAGLLPDTPAAGPAPVTAALDRDSLAGQPLAPVTATMRAMFGTSTELPGLAPDLLVYDTAGWVPTAELAGKHL